MTFLPTEDLNAEKASESAFRQVSTMLPGAPMYAEMQQLAAAYSAKGSKEEVFVRQVVAIGELLQVPVTQIWLPSCEKHHLLHSNSRRCKAPARCLSRQTSGRLQFFEHW